MAKRFKTGNKSFVLRRMARFAIRDQQALIEALTPSFESVDPETAKAIQSCKDNIEDFKRIHRDA